MKRGLCALIIFCLCIALSVYFGEKNKSALQNAEISLNEIRLLCEDGNKADALKRANKLTEEWKKEHLIIKITLEQSAVKEIETALKSIPRLIENGETKTAIEKCEDTKCEIEYLLEKEKISFENIF